MRPEVPRLDQLDSVAATSNDFFKPSPLAGGQLAGESQNPQAHPCRWKGHGGLRSRWESAMLWLGPEDGC